MTLVLENLLVALVVAGCAVFSTWRLLSPKLRMRVLDLIDPVLSKVARGWIARLRSRTLQQLAGGGCGSCSRATSAAVHGRSQRPAAR
jgi:hypothetical protein